MADDLTEQYLAWMVAEHHPPATIARRSAVLRSVGNAGTATREEIEAWWAARRDQAPSTRGNALSCLRVFYAWCLRWEHRDDDPTKRLDPPKVPRTLPRPMARGDVHRLLSTLPDDLRRAVALGAYAGLRVSEAASLNWADVDIEMRRLYVTGKGSKTRAVGLSALLLDAIAPDVGGNVITAGGTPYTAGNLQRKINRAIRAAEVDATYHQLRHRFATVALASTGNLLAVSRAMGHSTPATTAIYAEASDADLDIIADAVTR